MKKFLIIRVILNNKYSNGLSIGRVHKILLFLEKLFINRILARLFFVRKDLLIGPLRG
jgi:hypothetical protein